MKEIVMALVFALVPAYAHAEAEIAGVKLPAETVLDGKKLLFNGAGLRVKIVFKVYAAALYSERTSTEPAELLKLAGPLRVELHFLRNVDSSAVARAISEGFAKNSALELKELADRLERFTALIPDVKKGNSLAFNFRPGRGVEAVSGDKSLGRIEGDDFSRALLKVWLGADPVDSKLKKGMLGL